MLQILYLQPTDAPFCRLSVDYENTPEGRRSALTIDKTMRGDSGFYVCNTKNIFGSDSIMIRLLVLGKYFRDVCFTFLVFHWHRNGSNGSIAFFYEMNNIFFHNQNECGFKRKSCASHNG